MAKKFKTVQDFRNFDPSFFSKENQRLFKDIKYRVWKGFLIIETGQKAQLPIYRIENNLLLCAGRGKDVESCRKFIDEYLKDNPNEL